ncbi:unnamed protein product [Allacma fusca]|uniref:SCP domain-containing protein n=1 Tax=Allacma fusca TaxID=39272 RepID=A0A8J2PUR1_9HEXA|nr:unnamed protein product [Allacma fusca]
MKFILAIVSLLTCVYGQDDIQNDMLNRHNIVRRNHKVGNLRTSADLIRRAQFCAKDYAGRGAIDHKCSQNKGVGENLSWSMSSNGSPKPQTATKQAFDGWYNENQNYNYRNGLSGNGKVIGHFTQQVWKSSTELGCAWAANPADAVLFRVANIPTSESDVNILYLKNVMRFIWVIVCLVTSVFGRNDIQNDMLKRHNAVRRNHKVGDLRTSEDLVRRAQLCAKDYAGRDTIDHKCNQKNGAGENLAWSMSTDGSPGPQTATKQAFDGWYKENQNYNYRHGRSGNGKVTGHFTQQVWKSSTEMGCGWAANHGRKSSVVVCLYNPPGNFQNEYTRNVFSPH